MSAALARSSTTAFAIHLGGAGLTYCAQLAIARAAGADGYGIYAYVFAWMTTLAYFAALGFDVALLRYVPAYAAREQWGLVRGVLRFSERWVGAVGLGVALACVAVTVAWPGERDPVLTGTFLAGSWLVPILALLWIRSSAVRGFGGVLTALGPDRIVRDGGVVCAVGVAGFVLQWPVGPAWAMAATVGSSALGLILVSFAMRRRTPAAVRAASARTDGRAWLVAAMPLLTLGAVEVATNRTGTVLLGWAGMTREAGVYAMAFNIAALAMLPRVAINALFAPSVAAFHARRDMAGLQALATRTSVWTLAGASVIAVALGVASEPLLRSFGPEFTAGLTALRTLLFAQVLAASAGSQLYLLTMTGHERSAAVLSVAAALANFGLGVLLIPHLGLLGAALALSITIIIWNCAMAILVWRLLQLIPGVLAAVWPAASARVSEAPSP